MGMGKTRQGTNKQKAPGKRLAYLQSSSLWGEARGRTTPEHAHTNQQAHNRDDPLPTCMEAICEDLVSLPLILTPNHQYLCCSYPEVTLECS